jgi:hypothetical protein
MNTNGTTQLKRLAVLFLEGKKITVRQAESFYGMKNLRARVSELRDMGYDIRSEMAKISKDDTRKRARYFLARQRAW